MMQIIMKNQAPSNNNYNIENNNQISGVPFKIIFQQIIL